MPEDIANKINSVQPPKPAGQTPGEKKASINAQLAQEELNEANSTQLGFMSSSPAVSSVVEQFNKEQTEYDSSQISSATGPARYVPEKPLDNNTTTAAENDNTKNIKRSGIRDMRLARPHPGLSDSNIMPFDPDYISETTSGMDSGKAHDNDTTTGVPSLMNIYSYSTFHGVGHDKKHLLYDIPGERRWYDVTAGDKEYNYKNPSVQNLIDFFGEYDPGIGFGTQPYTYSDFAYCKWFNKIPNNRLITLRRYTVPIYDNFRMPDWKPLAEGQGKNENRTLDNHKFVPIAQAVTWIGKECGNELSTLMNFSVGLPWEEAKGDATKVGSDDTSDTVVESAGTFGSAFKAISILTGEANLDQAKNDHMQYRDPYENGPYQNKVLGPVNCIKNTKKRKQGLEFTHEFTLTFKYTARSLGGVNGKAALLDIMSNFLVMCYGVGAFWGGMNRWDGRIIAFPWKEGMHAWYKGDFVAFMKASTNAINKAGNKLSALLDKLKNDPIEALKGIASDALNVGAGALFNRLGRQPQQAPQVRALLTGNPVGEWHVVIGNPFAPMMMIGNLICTGCDFEWGNELGPDDFPLDLTVKVKLQHGMGRDRHMAESMFNQGWGRIYTIPSEIEDTSAANESKIDAYTGKYPDKKLGTGKTKKYSADDYINVVTENIETGKEWGGILNAKSAEVSNTRGWFISKDDAHHSIGRMAVDGVGSAATKIHNAGKKK